MNITIKTKKIEVFIEDLKEGMSIAEFLDCPAVFQNLTEVSISFLKRIPFKKIKVRRFGLEMDVTADELFPSDEVVRFFPLKTPLLVKSQKIIDVLAQYGFKKFIIEIQDKEEKKVKSIQERREETRKKLEHLKENVDQSQKIINQGYEVLNDMFDAKTITKQHVKGAEELAKSMVSNISKNSQASTVLSILKDHDEYTFRHCVDVANQVIITCNYMGCFSAKEMEIISLGGLLHDIGKSMIPLEIINKPGPLSDEEWTIMRKHPTYSAEILERQGVDQMAIDIAHYHHVKKNGKGYPDKSFLEIGDLARITAISDVYQALVTKRPYKVTDPPNIALGKIRQWASDDFDEKMVDIFIKSFGVYPIGSLVLLSNKAVAFVVGRGDETTRPQVAVVVDENRKLVKNSEFMDLSHPEFNEVKIIKPLDHRKIFKDKASDIFMRLELK